jgi:hypothetical protein
MVENRALAINIIRAGSNMVKNSATSLQSASKKWWREFPAYGVACQGSILIEIRNKVIGYVD